MDNPASSQTFHLFGHLPPELRDRIWSFCLPCRVVPVDDPLFEPDKANEQQCWLGYRDVCYRAAAPPLIASVCREARQVACGWGAVEEEPYMYGGSLSNIWIQRKLDTVLCAWTPNHSALAGHDEDMLGYFLWTQRHDYPGAPVCLLAQHFLEFYHDASARENEHGPYISMDVKDELNSITYLLQDATREKYERNDVDVGVAMDVDVVMETIYIHASRTDLLASQLFGRNADEPAQLVGYDDAATLAKFRGLFEKNLKNQQRTAVARLFNAIDSLEFLSQVRRWLAKVEWKLLALKWVFEKHHNPQSIIYNDPAQVFNNYDVGRLMFSRGSNPKNTFKLDHPWVIQETARLPKLKPKIWFTYCTNDCSIR